MDKRHEEIIKENEIKHADNRLIEEIFADDRGAVKAIIEDNGTHWSFPDASRAGMFHIACIPKALEKLGVQNAAKISGDDIERVLDEHNIRFEKRNDPEEQWRSGIYIYKNNELAYFISGVLKNKPSTIFIPGRSLDGYGVITNVMRA